MVEHPSRGPIPSTRSIELRDWIDTDGPPLAVPDSKPSPSSAFGDHSDLIGLARGIALDQTRTVLDAALDDSRGSECAFKQRRTGGRGRLIDD
jgi:hypothetical protein